MPFLIDVGFWNLKSEILESDKSIYQNPKMLIDFWFIWILKPQIKNSWVRHKQPPESEHSDNDFWNQLSDVNLEKLPYIYYNFTRTIYMLFAVPC